MAGIAAVRKEVKEFIHGRDGTSPEVDDIFLTNGASQGVEMVTRSQLLFFSSFLFLSISSRHSRFVKHPPWPLPDFFVDAPNLR